MSSYTTSDATIDGLPVVVLGAREAQLEAAFAPGTGMIGCSLRHRGEELLGQGGGLAKYAETGSTMGIPLLHPWANRLDGPRYAVAGHEVELDPQHTPTRPDENGRPIHGLAAACPYWEVTETAADGDGARLAARLDWEAHAELMAGFPFAHVLELEVGLGGLTVTIEAVLHATGDVPVPVSFGFHPYLALPGVPRPEWEVTLPLRQRALLDERGIPTGQLEPAQCGTAPLGERTFDDLFVELCHPPEFRLRGGGRCLEVRFERGFPVAQVFAPPGEEFICFEPMTAPTNALVTGERLQFVAPGERYIACFSLSVLDG